MLLAGKKLSMKLVTGRDSSDEDWDLLWAPDLLPTIAPAELTSKKNRLMTSETRQGVDGKSPNLIY